MFSQPRPSLPHLPEEEGQTDPGDIRCLSPHCNHSSAFLEMDLKWEGKGPHPDAALFLLPSADALRASPQSFVIPASPGLPWTSLLQKTDLLCSLLHFQEGRAVGSPECGDLPGGVRSIRFL